MDNSVVSDFAKLINGDSDTTDAGSEVFGTVVSYSGGSAVVRIDGSEASTDCKTAVACKVGERVIVRIKDHEAIVTSNITSPSTDDTVADEAKQSASDAMSTASDAMSKAEATESYFWHDATGAYVSGSANSKSGKYARVTTTSFDIMDGSKTVSTYGSDGVKFYAEGESSPCVNIDNDSIDFYNTSVSETVPRVSMTSSSSHGSVALANSSNKLMWLWAQKSGINQQIGSGTSSHWTSLDDGSSSYAAGFYVGNSGTINFRALDSGIAASRGNLYARYGDSTYGTSLNYSTSNSVHGLYSNAKGKWIIGMDSNGVTHTYNTSSRKTKENIEPMPDAQALALLNVEVVDFDYKPEYGGGKNLTGVIAEDTADIVPEAIIENVRGCSDDEGEVEEIMGIDYSKFIPRLIKLCQIQQREIEELKQRLGD